MKEKEPRRVCRKFFGCLVLTLAFAIVFGSMPGLAAEKAYPSKPVEIVVPYAPGGVIDIGARIFAKSFSKTLGTPAVIRNRKGAGGLVGVTDFYKNKPDGYTLLACSPSSGLSAVQRQKNPAFDPRTDFKPIAQLGVSPVAMGIGKKVPFKSFNEFVQYAKQNPMKLSGGYSSPGGETHAMFTSILDEANIKTKVVPYTSSGARSAALLGGHIDWCTASLVSMLPYIRSGDIKPLLVTQKSPQMPDIPTGAEVGLPGVSVNIWIGLFVNAKTPKDNYFKLVKATKEALDNPETVQQLEKAGLIVDYKDPVEFSEIVKKDYAAFTKLLESTGMQVK